MNWPFFGPKIDHEQVLTAIRVAEEETSGEIRVLIARHAAADPLAAAQGHFLRLGLDQSPAHNGVLIFVAPRSRSFAVIGDRAVHEQCGEAFWADLAKAMGVHFKRGDFTAGLVHGVERAGELLAAHFPRRPGDQPPGPPQAIDVDA